MSSKAKPTFSESKHLDKFLIVRAKEFKVHSDGHVPWLQIITFPPPCLKLGVYADVLHLIFYKRGALNYSQTFPLWSCLSKEYYSKNVVVGNCKF